MKLSSKKISHMPVKQWLLPILFGILLSYFLTTTVIVQPARSQKIPDEVLQNDSHTPPEPTDAPSPKIKQTSTPETPVVKTKLLEGSTNAPVTKSKTHSSSPSLESPPFTTEDISPHAPLCPESAHSTTKFHTLWNPQLLCHYDHEHGTNPFTPEVANIFPGFNLLSLLGNVEVGHTNLSSAMENTHKHGGFKWQVTPTHPQGCAGFEGATNGVNGSVIEYHGFGDYSIEMESRIHTAVGLLRMCNPRNATDYGYLYTTQFEDYGQRISPYQGTLIHYPNSPVPAYRTGFGPYLSVDCFGSGPGCRTSRELVLTRNLDANTNWTSKRTGTSNTVGSTLFQLFFRARDTYQLFDSSDTTPPFHFAWLCSSDGGVTYNPSGCRYNNTTTQVHEIAGEIPASWDNLEGFDTNSQTGRITAEGYTTRFGALNRSCSAPGEDCHPIKMINAFVGKYGSVLFFTPGKGVNTSGYLPERDIYFCNGVVCSEKSTGSTPSGWVGASN